MPESPNLLSVGKMRLNNLNFSQKIKIQKSKIINLLYYQPRSQGLHEVVYYLLSEGHCHAIWQLCKKLEGVFASTEFQN